MLVWNYNSTAHHTFNSLQRHQGTVPPPPTSPVTSLGREPAVDRSEHQRLLRICYSVHPPIARAGQGNCEVYKLRVLRCSQESIKGALAFNNAVIMTRQRDGCQPKSDRGMGDSKCGIPFTVTAMRELSCLHSVRRVPKVLQFKLYSWKRVKYM